ncbi:hypothetical protein RCL_jg22939.t1 [Rhizophagus clarus]|uniref:Cysteine dioxygenase n=1 Tax=Rhizophagus clarus TaxID=94130 RepID=A0A8H3L621_9GLOM|nr:hypothetical protein RCL_jg22939.t1 [Rhizophagus clarus]
MASSEYYMQPRYYRDHDIILGLDDSSSNTVKSIINKEVVAYSSHVKEHYIGDFEIYSDNPDEPYRLSRVKDTDYYRINNLTINGQGTVGLEFKAIKNSSICIKLQSSIEDSDFISLDIGTECARILMHKDNKEVVLAKKEDRNALLNPEKYQLYWFSLDKKNCILRYGIGPMQSILTVLSHNFEEQKKKDKSWIEGMQKWFKNIEVVIVRGLVTRQEDVNRLIYSRLIFWPLPVTVDLPPKIIKREDATLEGLELGIVTVIDNLPEMCQKLYWNIAGNNVSLNTPDFPDFADAIEHSIRDNKGICYKKLEEKAKNAKVKDPKETYLRITLGQDKGNSPGAPYVLEIWPSGHYSSIHEHANCFAVIKVLYNEIVALYFAGLKTAEERNWYYDMEFKQGEITWISNELYQTHQLWNRTSKMCATLQCYQYGDKDKEHYEYFDYIGPEGSKKRFYPESDWTFPAFKNLIKQEWKEWKFPFNEPPSRRKVQR